MPRTLTKGNDIGDGTIGRVDLNVSTAGQAVISKILEVAGSGIKINSSSGADAGTGDVGMILDWTTLDARWLKLSGGTMVNTTVVTNLNADLLDGLHGASYFKYASFTEDANTMASQRSGFTYAVNAPWWGPLVHFDANNYGLQLNSNYLTARTLAFRTHNGDPNAWNNWIHLFGYRDDLPGNSGYLPRISSDSYFVNSNIYDNGNVIIGTNWVNHTAAKLNVPYDIWVGDYNTWVNFSLEGQINLKILNNTHGIIKSNWADDSRGGITMQYTGDGAGTMVDGIVLNYLGKVGIGTTNPLYSLQISNQLMMIHNSDFVSGTTGSGLFVGLNAASGGTTAFIRSFTNGGANTNNLAIQSAGGTTSFGSLSGTAIVHIKGSTATAGTGSLKIDSGSLLTTTEAGLFENNGTHLYFTFANGGTRYQLDQQGVTTTAAALTKVDDINVTMTLGGTPATALLQSVSLTLGWTGTLADGKIASANAWNAKQAGHTNLTSLAGLVYASGAFVKMTAAGTFSLDASSYVTGTPWTAMGYVTGTPWTAVGYLTSQISHADVLVDGDFSSQGIMKRGATAGIYSIAINSDLPIMTATVGGAVPTPPNDATKYLNGQGGWTIPSGGGLTGTGTASSGVLAVWKGGSSLGTSWIQYFGTGSMQMSSISPAGGGSANTFIGSVAVGGTNITWVSGSDGGYNTGYGNTAGLALTTGNGNSLFGAQAGINLTIGTSNTMIGFGSGAYYTGLNSLTNASNCIYIGNGANASANGNTNEIVIGTNIYGGGSNTVLLGNSSILKTYLQGSIVSKYTTMPASSTATGEAGEIRVGGGYIYLCTAANTWRRVAVTGTF